MSNQSRQPKGIPAGGQFAASARAEADLALETPEPLDRESLMQVWDLEMRLRRFNDTDAHLPMPGGGVLRIESWEDFSETGIIESGQYTVTGPGQAFMACSFDDLPSRSDAAQRVAERCVRMSLNNEGALDDNDAAPVIVDLPEDAIRDGEGTAIDQDGKVYVDDPDSFWHGTEIISTYTRAQALSDGTLKDRLADGTDLSQMAREAGIPVPVAFTAAAFHDSVAWSESNAELQDESGRAWDVLWMANRPLRAHAAKNNGSLRVGDRIPFSFVRVPNTPRATQPRKAELHAVFGTDDNGEPCFTFMLPSED